MSLLLVPYTNAMRLGQGFNSYTQQICVDDAVVVDNERAENILLNDGTTMRILTQSTGKASAWTRQREVVIDDRTVGIRTEPLPEVQESEPVLKPGNGVTFKQVAAAQQAKKDAASSPKVNEPSSDDTPKDASLETVTDAKDEEEEKDAKDVALDDQESTEAKVATPAKRAAPTSKPDESSAALKKLEEDTVAQKTAQLKAEKEDSDAIREAERERVRIEREYQKEVERDAREEDRRRREEEREEQRAVRREKREFEQERRKDMYKSIKEAAAAKSTALSIQEMQNILKQNQFAERWNGMPENNENIAFDKTAPRGPSQTVTYTSRFIDRLSDITDDMCISGALSIKAAKIGGSGRGSFIDSDKFKESDLTFYISVKVINQTINFKDALQFKPINGVKGDKFNKVFGDSFISGFLEGGEFNAVVSMKILNKSKKTDIQAEAKVAFTAGPMSVTAEANVGIARENLETNTETTIQVSWCGGGHIKPMEQQWDIKSLMAAAARFPDLVADCPQRTYAILTKYDSLRSFVVRQPPAYSKMQYENAQMYTNVLMDAFMSYKALYKQLSDQIFQVKNKTMEILPWEGKGEDAPPQPDKDENKKEEKDDKSVRPFFYKYVEDNSRFDANLAGLDKARKAIRRQMARIANEVDDIEENPKLATDEDHEEPFQAPTAFEMRLPTVQVPERLRPKEIPLTGQRIISKTQTEEEAQEEAKKLETREKAPPLYSDDEGMNMDEATIFTDFVTKNHDIGRHLQVTKAVGAPSYGDWFNNMDFIKDDWHIKTIRVKYWAGMIGGITIEYDNGLVVQRGEPAPDKSVVKDDDVKELGPFGSKERIVAGSVQTGMFHGGEHLCILSLRLYTNRGGSLIADTPDNKIEQVPDDPNKIKRDGYTYHTLETHHFDCPMNKGTLKGFYGRSIKKNGGLRRLGFIWGDVLQ